MNKTAVALATDSAVTIEQIGDRKVYNSANKLFTLSKYRPVGIMLYGSADFMGIPWESIIKIYRSELGTHKFDTLKEYADNFIDFLNRKSISAVLSSAIFTRSRTKFLRKFDQLSMTKGELRTIRLSE
jgi:hypothetical protein